MLYDRSIYEFFGLPGSGKTTTAECAARMTGGAMLHGELLKNVERLGSKLCISLHFDPVEYWHFRQMARCVDGRIDRVQRRKIWQAEKNCLEYRLAMKSPQQEPVINDQGIVQAVLSICFDRTIRCPERFLRHFERVLSRYPVQPILLDCPPEEASQRIHRRSENKGGNVKLDSRVDRITDGQERLDTLRRIERNLALIRNALRPAPSFSALHPAEENAQALTVMIERGTHTAPETCLRSLPDRMTEEHLPWLVWCGTDHVERSLQGEGDLDLLIGEWAFERARQLLRQHGFLLGKPPVWTASPYAEHWYGWDRETGKLTHVHLHRQMEKEDLRKRRRVFLPLREAFERRVFSDGIWRQHPALEALLVLCQSAVGDLPKKEKRCAKRDHLLAVLPGCDAGSVLHSLGLPLSPEELTAMLCRLPETPKLPGELLFLYPRRWELPLRPFLRRHKRLMAIVSPFGQNKKRLSPCGFTVALAGQDGAGKTTLCGELSQWLGKHFTVKQHYMGSGSGRRSLRKRLLKHFPNACSAPLDTLRWMLRGGEAVSVAARAGRLLRRAERDRSRGVITLLDRLPQNSFPGYNDGPKLRAKAESEHLTGLRRRIVLRYAAREERLLAHAVRHPVDLVLLLSLSPEEAVRRKPENDIRTIRTKHDLLLQTDFAASSVVRIDAEQPYSDELRDVQRVLSEKLRRIGDGAPVI